MRSSLQRRLAVALLKLAIRIAPNHAAQWGEGMLAELGEVKGEWAALMWAAGGVSVLAKHALVALILHDRNVPAILPSGGFFVKEGPMRKAILGITGGCVAAALLFLLAPTFRQALGISLMQWPAMSQLSKWPPKAEPSLIAFERQAEQKHDPDALAFAAVLMDSETWNKTESARLAIEAVQLDPKLTWIYSMAGATPEVSEQWIQKLKQWDPQNALPYFMEAENIDLRQIGSNKFPHSVEVESAAWKNALGAAFRCAKLDDYHLRMRELTHTVAARYGVWDPYQIIEGVPAYGFPSSASADASRYAKSLLESGEKLEASGNPKGALGKYLEVISFGEATKSAGAWLFLGRFTLETAYEKAGALAQRKGDKTEAELYSYLATDFARHRDEQLTKWRQGWEWPANALNLWNANLTKVSGLLLPIFGAILLICALTIVAKNRPLRLSSLRVGRGVVALALGSACGLLLSSVLLFVSYGPYAQILREFVSTGNYSHLDDLGWFLAYTQVPLGFHPATPGYVYYFWLTVIVLGAVALLVIAARHVRFRHRIRTAS